MLSSILPKLNILEQTENRAVFVVEPLENIFGITVGNAMRRSLLSALPGVAITGVRVQGALHEFSTLPGMKEDVLDFVLNVKQLRIRQLQPFEGSVVLKLTHKGDGIVTAKEIDCPPQVEIVNADHYLAKLVDKKAKLDIEFVVEHGRGYVSVEQRDNTRRKSVQLIPIDALFTPIQKVNFRVEPTRVGQITNYDKLILEITTDGTIQPMEALNLASAVLVEHFSLFVDEKNYKPVILDLSEPEETETIEEVELQSGLPLDMTIEDLGLSTRVLNSLHAANISTAEQLLNYSIEELKKLKNFGQKSLTEINEKLTERGLILSEGESVE